MKKILLLLVLSVFTHSIKSQVASIFDRETGEPLELVTLASESPRSSTITNSRGQTDISAFKTSEKIEIRAIGYKPTVLSYEQIEEKSFLIFLSPSVFNLDEVVVSAARWNQKTSEIPSKVVTLSLKSIYLQNPQTAADLLNISGKVFIQKSQQGGGSPMIRGFATNRLLYSVDGVRMNTAIFRGGNIQNVISLDPFAIEQTEVLFGPGSVIYGSDAIGGVMSFQSLTPQFSLNEKPLIKGKALTRFSSANNEKTAHFDINIGWKKWSMITSISTNNFGDLRMGSHGPDEYLRPFYVQRHDSTDVIITNTNPRVQTPSGYSQMNLMQKLHFKPNEAWAFQYGLHFSETSEYSRYDRHIRYKNGLPRYGEWYYGPQKWMMNNLNATYSNYNNLLFNKISFRLAWQQFEESRIDRDINKYIRHTRKEKVDALSANIDFTRIAKNNQTLYYGLEAVQNYVASTGTDKDISTATELTGPSRYPQSLWASYAVYISNQLKLSKKVIMQAGLRYNYFSLRADFDTTFYPFPFTKANLEDGALTGSLGIILRPVESLILTTNASTAFRSPNVDDMGKVFDSEPGAVTVPNPSLKAEYAYNIDLGIAKTFSDIVKIDVSLYRTLLRNALVRRGFMLNGLDSILYDGEMSRVMAMQNAANANIMGIQAGFEVKLVSGIGFSTDINLQRGEEELDDGSTSPSRHAPPTYGVSRLSYSANKLYIKLYAIYSGEKKYEDMPAEEAGKTEIYATDKNGNPYSPAWYTMNFKAMYQFTENLSVTAGVENITDIRYRPYSSGIVAPGRNFIMSLKANF
ncbi:MAG: TonB-dependent receptor [Bacteroidales bacterium]|nr:TonB-dependent receptor [Bacteroidales bacterium]